VAFLDYWRGQDDAVELVINGDLLDFVQAPPYKGSSLRAADRDGIPLCFTQDQSCDKLEAINSSHCKSFAALGSFLAHRPTNCITILPGNHDADFYWGRVQEKFRALVCGSNDGAAQRLRFWLDPVYRPELCPTLWIEHGHQHDQVNCFFIGGEPCWSAKNPPIRTDRLGNERLYECIGTRFLIQYLNDLDMKYPYVDNVKPFSRFLQLFGASALRPGFGPIHAAVAVASMHAFLAKTLVTHPKDVLKRDGGEPVSAASLVRAAFEKTSVSRQNAFIDAVRGRGYPLNISPKITLANENSAAALLSFLSDNLDLLDGIDSGPAEGTLKLGQAFRVDETNELRSHALRTVSDPNTGARFVIMGHTHEVVNEPSYINTGSWTRYYKLQAKERLRPWTVLRTKSWNEFPYQLNFALAKQGGDSLVELQTYK